jgi:hypothetical protein
LSDELTGRLNLVLPRITSNEFLSGTGIGNETPFYIFDYAPEEELRVREHVQFLLQHIPKQRPGMRVSHVNLFDLVIDHLRNRKLLESSYKMQLEKGDQRLLTELGKVLDAEKIAPVFTKAAEPENNDLVLVTGVGSVWPVLRTHNLLNNLQSRMAKTPLLMFYPGRYDGKNLRLFGKVESSPYYRAFRLIERA